MQNPEFAAAYEARKQAKKEARQNSSKFDYETAGGLFIPTEAQCNAAFRMLYNNHPEEEAANMVIYGYTAKIAIHHDSIHIVNEFIRTNQ